MRVNGWTPTEAQAIPLDKLRQPEDTLPASPDLLLPVATALADIPALALTEAEVGGLRHGQAISLVTLMGRIPPAPGRTPFGTPPAAIHAPPTPPSGARDHL